jgi:hypothetical protein
MRTTVLVQPNTLTHVHKLDDVYHMSILNLVFIFN